MFPVLKNKFSHIAWQPQANFKTMRMRSELYQTIRAFFAKRKVLEVETPLISHTSVTDPYIASIKVNLRALQVHYLQTSPEFAMKRLLAAGSGDIYQICKAFRLEESGRLHQPEFSMLEWYRLNFTHHHLMDEMDELLQLLLDIPQSVRFTYQEFFLTYCHFDPFQIDFPTLKKYLQAWQLNYPIIDIDSGLQILLNHVMEKNLIFKQAVFIYDFPISQALLAKINPGPPPYAARFEVYLAGIEIANGFHELQNPQEQYKRFKENLKLREKLNLPYIAIDNHLIAALDHGLPPCAGVALGLDRLLMIKLQETHIDKVLAFPIY